MAPERKTGSKRTVGPSHRLINLGRTGEGSLTENIDPEVLAQELANDNRPLITEPADQITDEEIQF